MLLEDDPSKGDQPNNENVLLRNRFLFHTVYFTGEVLSLLLYPIFVVCDPLVGREESLALVFLLHEVPKFRSFPKEFTNARARGRPRDELALYDHSHGEKGVVCFCERHRMDTNDGG